MAEKLADFRLKYEWKHLSLFVPRGLCGSCWQGWQGPQCGWFPEYYEELTPEDAEELAEFGDKGAFCGVCAGYPDNQ